MLKQIGWIVCGILLLIGCSGDENCESGPLDIMTMEELGCTNSVNLMKVRTGTEFELIRDQHTYDLLISGPCNPQIDWQVHDLIAGQLRLINGLIRIEESANFNCAQNILNITVSVYLNEATVTQEAFFGFLIPKLDNSEAPYVNFVTL